MPLRDGIFLILSLISRGGVYAGARVSPLYCDRRGASIYQRTDTRAKIRERPSRCLALRRSSYLRLDIINSRVPNDVIPRLVSPNVSYDPAGSERRFFYGNALTNRSISASFALNARTDGIRESIRRRFPTVEYPRGKFNERRFNEINAEASGQKERNNRLIRRCLVFESRDKLRRALGRISRRERRWSGGEFRDEPKRESRRKVGERGEGAKVASGRGWVKRGDGARMETAETQGGESERRWVARGGQGEWKGRGVRGGG